MNYYMRVTKKTGTKKTGAAGWSESSQRVFQKNGSRSGAAIINRTACSVFFYGRSRFRNSLFPDLVSKQSRKDPLKDSLKQSGARSAPGEFWGIWAPEAAKTEEMKHSGARSAPGLFWVFMVKIT